MGQNLTMVDLSIKESNYAWLYTQLPWKSREFRISPFEVNKTSFSFQQNFIEFESKLRLNLSNIYSRYSIIHQQQHALGFLHAAASSSWR